MRSQHPLYLGPSDTKLRGVWIRHKVTGAVGYVAHVERRRNPASRPLLWIVYPPTSHNKKGTGIKTYSAGSAYVDEVLRLKRKRKYIP